METKVDEIAERIYRLSTFAPEIAAPAGFTFNQFLIDADEPLLFHCGPRSLFPLVSKALGAIMPVERLRWISFGHVEADECGAMNLWLAAAPQAQVVHGQIACMVSLNDLADRPPRALADGESIDIGGRRVRYIDTPHVPHAWESGLIFEETTSTLFCGDLLTQIGQGPALVTDSVLDAAIAAENAFQATALTPATGPTIRLLAALTPRRLAMMHGSSYEGDCAAQLSQLADFYDAALAAKSAHPPPP
ncbi:MAG: MBL fold metallo-hydrolase [Alphaproteobacteria bacterium]|nr:MBL fold metallo-hydrolase [Alphaproteobacteria bacterium]MBM3654238.1 MBL fold metallo-hydrolase [Alphaproteobacteria bacterium]